MSFREDATGDHGDKSQLFLAQLLAQIDAEIIGLGEQEQIRGQQMSTSTLVKAAIKHESRQTLAGPALLRHQGALLW